MHQIIVFQEDPGEGRRIRYTVEDSKDVEREELLEELARLKKRMEEAAGYMQRQGNLRKHFVIVPRKKSEIVLEEDEIFYIERNKRVTSIHLKDEHVDTTQKMQEIYPYLDHLRFAYCHHSFIVNLEKIFSFSKGGLVMKDKTVIPVSRSHGKEFQEKFERWVRWCRGEAEEGKEE